MARLEEIIVPHGSIRALAKDMGLTDVTIRHALKGMTNSPNSYMIRKRALQLYRGVKLNK